VFIVEHSSISKHNSGGKKKTLQYWEMRPVASMVTIGGRFMYSQPIKFPIMNG